MQSHKRIDDGPNDSNKRIPVHVSSDNKIKTNQREKWQGKKEKTDCFYVGNIPNDTTVQDVVKIFEMNDIDVVKLTLRPNKQKACQGARVVTAQGYREKIMAKDFFPEDSYARPWYPKDKFENKYGDK